MSVIEKEELDTEKALSLLAKDGPLARFIPHFEIREEQQMMMKDVIEAYNDNKVALIEAGTGTGKSIAYLIPAIYWSLQHKERTLISTNTITLQEQLLHKDIPLLAEALNIDIKAVLVKGMGNYVCLRKLHEAGQEMSLFPDEEQEELLKIEKWAETTHDGSKTDLSFKPKPQTWEKACAESDTCTREKCSYYKKCHFFKARNRAKDANLLISNHSLLFADLSLRKGSEKGLGILPEYDKVILDEAHNIEDIATDYFASKASGFMIMRTLSRLQTENKGRVYGKLPYLYKLLIDTFGHEPDDSIKSLHVKLKVDIPSLRQELINHTFESFGTFAEFINVIHPATNENDPDGTGKTENKLRLLKQHHTHPSWKEEVLTQSAKLLNTLNNFIQTILNLESDLKNIVHEQFQEKSESIRTEIIALATRLDQVKSTIEHFIDKEIPTERVRWVESTKYRGQDYVELIDANLDISELLVENLFRKFPTTILTSATLTTNKNFHFIRQRLGLIPELMNGKPVIQNIYESPFDYPKQAMLAIPTDLPNPSDDEFAKEAARKIYLATKKCRGNAFVLFTSYSMMNYCHSLLKKPLEDLRYPLFMQGENTRKKLLDQFKSVDRSVLLGTDSFWEGIDVAGEALRCVIIVKLPFQVPNEPIIQARMEAIKAKGGNPFLDYSIPNAIVKFKQGFGRLIRKKKDRGCIICLDPRLITKPYGSLFINSLPNCQKLFIDSPRLFPAIEDFYRKTYYLTK
jgi:ATP-dependent DNA helicase DinG